MNTHGTIMQQFKDAGFVGPENLTAEPVGSALVIGGQIGCKGRIVISVLKTLEYVEGDKIQTIKYEYNVHVSGRGNVFRYDNCHAHDGHPDEHHKDCFDFPRATKHCEWVGADKWPTLGEVIEEARQWHSDHYDLLDDAEAFPSPDELQSTLRA